MTDSDKIILGSLVGFLILIAGLAVLTISLPGACHSECAAVMEAR